MGADLYIESVSDRNKQQWQPAFEAACRARDEATKTGDKSLADRLQAEVEDLYDKMNGEDGYFRDSYNKTSLFWVLGLSWWGDGDKLINKSGYMTVPKIKKLLAIVQSTDIPEPEDLDLEGACVDDGENSREAWHKFFVDKRKRFIAFLGHALDLNEKIRCSV